jgi:hypothetical protein
MGFPGGTTTEGRKQGKRADAVDTNAGNFSHCMELVTRWHEIRSDFEDKFYSLTQDELIRAGQSGSHKLEYFKGHCTGEGGSSYQHVQAKPESFQKVMELYS